MLFRSERTLVAIVVPHLNGPVRGERVELEVERAVAIDPARAELDPSGLAGLGLDDGVNDLRRGVERRGHVRVHFSLSSIVMETTPVSAAIGGSEIVRNFLGRKDRLLFCAPMRELTPK